MPENNGPDTELLREVDQSKLRQEAAPFPWEQLTRDQKRAILDCHRRFTMLEAEKFKPEPKSARHGIEHFLPNLHIDKQVNRVVLIDGGRGSGKSVALVRLFQFWSERLRQPGHEEGTETEPLPPFEATVAEVERPLTALRRKPLIVPIGYTSASLIENSTNFFTYIATYLHLVIEAITGVRTRAGERAPTMSSAWTSVADSGSELSQRWNRFLQAVAHATDTQPQERKKSLDPEQWALELRDSEFRRRDIPELFYDLMDQIVTEYATVFGTGGRYPLFVVGIDDADLVRGLQLVPLLNSIRRLDHPRMAFILTGDTPLFVEALSEGFLGRVRGPLRDLDLHEVEPMFDREHATRLARDIFDKVVPRNQRFKLPKLRLEERLTMVRESKAFCAIRFSAEALPQLVHETKVHQSTETRTLEYYFEKNPAVRAALPARLRDMVAFKEYLEARNRDVADVVQQLWRDGLERSAIAPDVEDILKPLVRRRYGGANNLEIQTYGINCEFLPGPIIPGRPLLDSWFVALREIAGYEITHDSSSRPLPEEAAAALILATDLAADSMHASFLGRSISPNEFGVPFVKVSYSAADLRTYDFAWPLPDWDAFVDFEIFSRFWRELLTVKGIAADVSIPGGRSDTLSKRRHAQRSMGRIAKLFLGLAIDISDRRDASIDELERDWPELAAQLNTLVQAEVRRGPYRRNRHTVEWARSHAVLLAAPESGLTAKDANACLAAVRDAGLLDIEAAQMARQRRVMRAVERQDETTDSSKVVKTLIDEIDERSKSYHWTRLKRAAPPSPEPTPAEGAPEPDAE